MAAEIGDVVVRVGGDITSLKQGMAAGASSVGAFSAKASKHLREVASETAKVGAAALAAGALIVVGIVNNGRQAIDAQAKLAQALGGTIGGLRALEMAAGDAGASEEALGKEITKLNSRLGEAQRGSGAAYEALKRLGLSAEELSRLDVDERMAVIADRIKELGLSSSVAQSELRDLGIRNENLATMMRQGGDAIREQANEVKNLGLNLSMVDAAQVEMANDALGVFGDVLTGVQDRLTVAAAPYITEISERFREAALESGGFKSQIEQTIETIIRGFGTAGDFIQGLHVVFKGLELVVVGFGAAAISSAQVALEAYSKVDEGITYVANNIIDALNLVFKTDIANVEPFTDSPFMEGLREMGETARNQVGVVREELVALAMQHMPSDKIEQFLAAVAQRSKEAAAEVVGARSTMVNMPENYMGGGEGGGEAGGASGGGEDAAAAANAAALESIKSRYMTEQELLREHRATMAIIGEEYDAANFETEGQWRSIKEQAEAEHIQRLHDITASGYDGIQSLIHSSWGAVGAETAGAMKSVLNTVAVGSRKAFEVSKAWATADALISTYQGIAAGVKLGWPMAVPAVAWAAATGFAQLSNIKNQSFGGAGGAAAAGSGTPATAGNPVGVGGAASAPQQDRVMRVEGVDSGSLFSGNQLRGLVQAIDDFKSDGGGRVVMS